LELCVRLDALLVRGVTKRTTELMKTRFVPIFFLLMVLLNGAMGNVLAAALCPHSASEMACCPKHDSMDHGQMAGMEMTGVGEETAAADVVESDSFSSDGPSEPCSHCIMHSLAVNVPFVVRQIDRRGSDLTAPAPVNIALVLLPNVTFASLVSVRTHAPPDEGNRRYIRLSVFRI
jgi:hypothetical protein